MFIKNSLHMKISGKFWMLFLLVALVAFSSCSRNYYSGTGKGGRGCGCPANRY
jgi:hypothetical protein